MGRDAKVGRVKLARYTREDHVYGASRRIGKKKTTVLQSRGIYKL